MIWEEWKKIWRPGLLVGLLLLTALVSYSSLSNYWNLTGTKFGLMDMAILDGYKAFIEKYGTTLEDEEYVQLQEDLAVVEAERDAYVAQNEFAKEHDIKNWSDLLKFDKDNASPEEQKQYTELSAGLNGARSNHVLDRWAIVKWSILYYEYKMELFEKYQSEDEWEAEYIEKYGTDDADWLFSQRRMQLTFDEHEYWRQFFWGEIASTTSEYFTKLLIWIIVCLAILLSPLLVRDRMNNMLQLQFCSRTGRRIYYKQYITLLISALIFTTFMMLVMGGLFLRNGTLMFAECSLFSLQNPSAMLITYGTWWALNIVMIYLLCIGMAGFLFFLSQFSRSYVGMIVKLLPALVLIYLLFNYCFKNALLDDNRLYCDLSKQMGRLIQYAPMWAAVAVCVFGLGLGLGTCVCKQRAQL